MKKSEVKRLRAELDGGVHGYELDGGEYGYAPLLELGCALMEKDIEEGTFVEEYKCPLCFRMVSYDDRYMFHFGIEEEHTFYICHSCFDLIERQRNKTLTKQ